MKALVYGHNGRLMEAIPPLLQRAGFSVDVITTDVLLSRARHINNLKVVKSSKDLIDELMCKSSANYLLYVPVDDLILKEINSSNIPIEDKIKLLPIMREENLSHIYSKIGLAKTLEKNKITSPKYSIAFNKNDLYESAKTLRFPFIVKIDSSAGGAGIFECKCEEDIENLCNQTHLALFKYPLLIQEKIEGASIDLSGFYQQGKLVHFSYSEMLVSKPKIFGPSIIRKYYKRENIDQQIFENLSKLGAAIGANGFVTTTGIKSYLDGNLYFIEADMRPNVWVEHTKYFDDDPATHIRNYFEKKKFLQNASSNSYVSDEKQMIMAYLPRLDVISVLLNRYNCKRHYENYLSRSYFMQSLVKKIKPFLLRNTSNA